MERRFILVLIFTILSIGTLYAFEIPSMQFHGGLLWLGNGVEEGGPSPLLRTFGGSMQMFFTRRFFLHPELGFYGTQYQLAADGIKTIPTEIEFANSVWFLSTVLDLQTGMDFQLSSSFSLGFMVFPSFVFRIPLRSWGTCAEVSDESSTCKSTMSSYFYQKARFIYPGVGVYALWKTFDRLGIAVRIKGYIPLFHLWDGEVRADGSRVPFYDQMVISISGGIRYYFK